MPSRYDSFLRGEHEHAERGRGPRWPTPMVGAVVVAPSGAVVGEGVHMKAGAPHAEIEALRAAGPRAPGAMLYLTPEPGAHQGRTPPCATAVVGAGAARRGAPPREPDPA